MYGLKQRLVGKGFVEHKQFGLVEFLHMLCRGVTGDQNAGLIGTVFFMNGLYQVRAKFFVQAVVY
jgi:hypothetical protein